MQLVFYNHEVKVFDENVSSNYIIVLLPDITPLSK